MLRFLLPGLLCFLLKAQLIGQSQPFIYEISGSSETYLTGINDARDLVGYYKQSNGTYRAFKLDRNGVFTKIKNPADTSLSTYAMSINSYGYIVGRYEPTNAQDAQGFMYNENGIGDPFINITAGLGSVDYITTSGINDSLCYTGEARNGPMRQFYFRCPGDVFNNQQINLTLPSYGKAIDDAGRIAGYFIDSGITKGFVWRGPGEADLFMALGGNKTRFFGMNNGNKCAGDIGNNRAALFTVSPGFELTQIQITGAVESHAMDVNNNEEVVGYFTAADGKIKGFIYKRTFVNGFQVNPDGWSFDNDDDPMWPESAYSGYDYMKDSYLKQFGVIKSFPVEPADNLPYRKSTFPPWKEFVRIFGEARCYTGQGNSRVIRQSAFKYWDAINEATWKGSCFGMTSSAGLVRYNPSLLTNRFQSVGGFGNAYTKQFGPELRWMIHDLQLYQFGIDQNTIESAHRNENSLVTIQNLKNAFMDGSLDDYTLTIRRTVRGKPGGHSLFPYKIVANQDDSHSIYVYDPNYHGNENRIIQVSSTGVWLYSASENSSAASEPWNLDYASDLYIWGPISQVFRGPAIHALAPWSPRPVAVNPSRDIGNYRVYINKPGRSVVLNSTGDSLGYWGYQLKHDFSDGEVLLENTGYDSNPYGYSVPLGAYTVKISDVHSQSFDFGMIADSSYYTITVPVTDSNSVNQFSLGQAGQGLASYVNTQLVPVPVTLSTSINSGDGELIYTISDVLVAPNGNVGLEVINEDELLFTNNSGDAGYTISITYTTSEGTSHFEHADIPLADDETHHIIPDLSDLSSGETEIQIDNGQNGSIEDTLTFENQLAPALLLSASGLELGDESGTASFGISNNGGGSLNWVVASKPSWVAVTSASTGSGNASIDFTYETNPNPGVAREGYIVLQASGATNSPDSFLLVQNGFIPATIGDLKSDNLLRVFPNPFSENLSIETTTPSGSQVILKVYDLSGRVVKTADWINWGGTHTQELSFNGVENGFYLVEISVGGQKRTIRVIHD